MASVLFLPSTPLNILVSAALACHLRQQQGDSFQAEMWLIDQKNTDHNPYQQALNQWPDSPFKRVKCLPGKAKGRQKYQERKQNFKTIQHGLADFQPNIIATGSDRRIEFQYAMHHLKQNNKLANPPAQGWYLDDGLYSYAGRPYHPIKDGINSLIKKLSYGFWWQEPKTVGASNWIQQAWLFQPQQAHRLIKTKQMHQLKTSWFQTTEIKELSKYLTEQFAFDGQCLASIDVVLIIPHPYNQLKMKNYAPRIQAFVKQLVTQGKRIALKYHPRQQQKDALGLAQQSDLVKVIPSGLAFEFVLPLLPTGAKVIGDVGTVLLTTKWLRGDVEPIALLDTQDPFQQRFVTMLVNNNIRLIEGQDLLKTFNLQGVPVA